MCRGGGISIDLFGGFAARLYFRSKQKVQDKVGPLEGSDGNIITEERKPK